MSEIILAAEIMKTNKDRPLPQRLYSLGKRIIQEYNMMNTILDA